MPDRLTETPALDWTLSVEARIVALELKRGPMAGSDCSARILLGPEPAVAEALARWLEERDFGERE